MVTPHGTGFPDVEKLRVTMGSPDDRNRRKIVVKLNGFQHVHLFDPLDQFQRRQFREAAISKLNLPDDAHETLESEILAAAAASPAELATANVISLADIEAKPVEWFWEHYLPAGAITDISGDPNEGKSTLLIDLVARNSRGDSMPPVNAPDETYTPGNSLLITGEDDVERTVKPRLLAADADVRRIHLLRSVTVCDEERSILLPLDLPLIERVITERKINLVGIDVLSAFTEPGTSLNDDAAMRRLFNPLAAVAQRTQAAFVVLRHMNKREGTRAMYRAGGSIAITGACRAAFAVAPNPDDPTEKVFVPIKHNLGPRPHSLTYRIEAYGDSSRIVWGGQTELTASDVLKAQPETNQGNKFEQAKAIIADVLSSGPRGENEVKTAIEQSGLSYSTYWRARRAMGVRSEKTAFNGEWLLSLPAESEGYQDDKFAQGSHEGYQP